MKTELIRNKYLTILGGSFLYAIFYTFCLYKNPAGITMPFLVVGTLGAIYGVFRLLEFEFRKHIWVYSIGVIALSISTVLTDDSTIHFWNKVAITLLLISMVLHQLYEDKNWGFGTYIKNIVFMILGSIGNFYHVFTDAIGWTKEQEHGKFKQLLYAFIGFVISVPIIFIIGCLLITSDVVIIEFVVSLMKDIDFIHIFGIAFMLGIVFFVSYGAAVFVAKRNLVVVEKERRILEPIIIVTVTSLLFLMYLSYSIVQILYLFWGKMELPASYTYAEYAREGFFQLLIVCIFNLILVLISITFFKKSNWLNIILLGISFCTYIMLISSGLRMIMYIRFYYLSYLRVLVLWGVVVIFLLLSGTIITIFKEKFPLFRYGIIVVTCCYFVLAFGKPDYWIAKINCANVNQVKYDFFLGEHYYDYDYLTTLSLDAHSVIDDLIEENMMVAAYIPIWNEKVQDKLDDMDVRTYNFSIAAAKE